MSAPPFDIVVAADRAWGIGRDNALPWPPLAADLAHLESLTRTAPPGRRNAILVGRRTWESNEMRCRPLPGRLNIVVSRGAPAVPAGVLAARSLPEALRLASASDIAHAFVLGGAELYRAALAHPGFRFAYLTRLERAFDCDTHIPSLDHLALDPTWTSGAAGRHEEAGISYTIERRRKLPGGIEIS